MASPQVEDGYTKIANELFDAVLRYDFSKRQIKVMMFLIRKLYGWGKTEDYISSTQISSATGLDESNVRKAIVELKEIGALKVSGRLIGIEKNYESWAGQNNPLPGQNNPGQNNPLPGQNNPGQNNPLPGQNNPGQNNPLPGQNNPGQNNPLPGQNNPPPGQNNPENRVKTTRTKEKKETITKEIVPKPEFVTDQVWLDFLALRKARRAPISKTALDKIASEAVKANITLETALSECVARGWQGFKAEWYARQQININPQQAIAPIRRTFKVMQ